MARTYARTIVSFRLPQQVQATGIQYLEGFFVCCPRRCLAERLSVKTPRAHRSRLRSAVSGEFRPDVD
jgi:hypothetical protein